MTLNVYIASITANTEVRKQVQKVLMVLDGLGVPFKAIDITLRGNEQYRDFMRQNALNERCDGVPLPPQFFVDDEYLGNYMDFEEAVEDNHLPEFLRLIPSSAEDEDDDEGEDEEDEEEGTSEGEMSEKYDASYDEDEEDQQEGDEEGQVDEQSEDDNGDVSSGLGSSSNEDDPKKISKNDKVVGSNIEDKVNNEEETEGDKDDEVELDDNEAELEDEDFEDEDQVE
uniref:Glutaredoxin domain-containing protein n=1 Tax=Wuchereria bancrofti TaxID=6293 RepID=A0AAF5Q0F2_WUCBA